MRTFIIFLLLIVSFAGEAQTKHKFYIADRKADCLGEVAKCLQLRESTKEKWHNLSGKIDGFNYEEGYEYRIQIEKVQSGTTTGNPNFKLVKILSKRKTDYNPAEKLANKDWFVHIFYHDTTFIKMMDTTAMHLNFDVMYGHVKIKGFCNNMNGPLSISKDSISIGDIVSTKVACAGNSMESILTGMLQQMKRYEISGNTLTLFYPAEKDRIILKAVIKN